ncbi:histidine kinase [Bacillus manliponensis]|uniref:histidine kinase n=1 Tax=Bacillus manliponensis TaxID=574376 RepID=A0A073JQU7_9BACI|nr:HAMP domain-containing sensor histidine kinase [Bacillus manliponensis]KEK17414.1 histidine kinase [Bacillus manliponensis]
MKRIFKPFRYVFSSMKNLIRRTIHVVQKSIRIQLVVTFIACSLLGVFVTSSLNPFFENANQHAYINYSNGMREINENARQKAMSLSEQNTVEAIQSMIDDENASIDYYDSQIKVLITDETGKVLYKTKQAQEEQINLHDTIRNAMDFTIHYPAYLEGDMEGTRKEFIAFYPLKVAEQSLYMFVSGLPKGEIQYSTSSSPGPFFIGVLVFIFSFLYITKRKMKQIESMAHGIKEIEKGNLAYRIEKKGHDELAELTDNINNMAQQLMVNIEKERRIEKQKNELITNVSHDLRTPLTSVMGYLRLLRDAKYENKEQYDEYVRIAFSKSEQLKALIEDLFEYTKLTNENIVLEKETVCINELLEQLIEEFVPQAEEEGLSFVKKLPDEKIYVKVDPEKTVRIFENLLMNAIKYSKEESEIKVSLQRQRRSMQITVSNYSEEFTREELESIFERFYKKDISRSKVIEGSGLGLAIVKSIVELQGGEIRAEYEEGIIQFIVSLPIIEE